MKRVADAGPIIALAKIDSPVLALERRCIDAAVFRSKLRQKVAANTAI